VVRWFFETPWICFQSLWVRREALRHLTRRNSGYAYRKLLYAMLSARMSHFDQLPGGPRDFEVRADQFDSMNPAKAKKEFRLLSAVSKYQSKSNRSPVVDFQRVDSREHRGVQLADLLVGAIRGSWEGKPSGPRATLCNVISTHLGWPDLRATTDANLKFHVWMPADFGPPPRNLRPRKLTLKCADGDPESEFWLHKNMVSDTM
jgi:hypothetical protein